MLLSPGAAARALAPEAACGQNGQEGALGQRAELVVYNEAEKIFFASLPRGFHDDAQKFREGGDFLGSPQGRVRDITSRLTGWLER